MPALRALSPSFASSCCWSSLRKSTLLGTLLAWNLRTAPPFMGRDNGSWTLIKGLLHHFPFKGDASRIIEWPPQLSPTSQLMAVGASPPWRLLVLPPEELKNMVSSSSKAIDFEYQAPQGVTVRVPKSDTWPDTQAASVIDQTMRNLRRKFEGGEQHNHTDDTSFRPEPEEERRAWLGPEFSAKELLKRRRP